MNPRCWIVRADELVEVVRDPGPVDHGSRSPTAAPAGSLRPPPPRAPEGNYGAGTQKSAVTNQCHDITVLPEAGLAAGACAGNGILLDISDPVHPVRLDDVADKNFAYWHSATFNNDGSKVHVHGRVGRRHAARAAVRRTCRTGAPTPSSTSSIDKMTFRGLLQDAGAADRAGELRGAQRVARSPCPGATSWCRRGIRAASRSSISPTRRIRSRSRSSTAARSTPARLITGGFWSAYWYNGRIYGIGDRPRPRRVQADAERAPLAERDRRREPGALRGVQRAAPASGDLAGDPGGRARLRRSARAEQGAHAGSCQALRAAVAQAGRAGSSKGPEAAGRMDGLAAELETAAAAATGRDAVRAALAWPRPSKASATGAH